MPLATIRHSASAAAPPGDIWAALQAAEIWAGIGLINATSDGHLNDEGHLASFRFTTSAGGRTWEGTAKRAASTPGEQIEFALMTKEFRGRISIDLAPEADQTLMTVRLEAESSVMPATLFWGIVREAITSGLDRRVDQLAAGFAA